LINEACKNLVLAGIGSITIVDPTPITMEDLSSQYYFTPKDIGRSRAEVAVEALRTLNPRVHLQVDTRTEWTVSTLASYQLVCWSTHPLPDLVSLFKLLSIIKLTKIRYQ
jgi:ubiquitin-like 1-activating enzyme E1 A